VHEDSWEHFSQNADQISKLFADAGLSELLIALKPGESADIRL